MLLVSRFPERGLQIFDVDLMKILTANRRLASILDGCAQVRQLRGHKHRIP